MGGSGSTEPGHHRRRAVALGHTFGKQILLEQIGLRGVRQEGTSHESVILYVCSVPHPNVHQLCSPCYVSSRSEESKFLQFLSCGCIHVAVNYYCSYIVVLEICLISKCKHACIHRCQVLESVNR